MALPASGAIALSDVNVELGYSSTATIALNDAAVRTLFGIASGQISMSDGLGKSASLGYIEDVFSTYLYTGTGGSFDLVNGINLSTYGGLVWTKARSAATTHRLWDTTGRVGVLSTDTSNPQNESGAYPTYVYGLSNGHRVSSVIDYTNVSSVTYVSWTFRKAQKFFDVVSYTGNGTAGRTVAHNLGSTPGFMVVKQTNSAENWYCYHTSLGPTKIIALDAVDGAATVSNVWNDTAPTSSVFSLGNYSGVNGSGGSYVAYLFAHNAGGYGATGTDNIISCGTFTTSAGGVVPDVNLGYEPQWVIIKRSNTSGAWFVIDTMRLWSQTGTSYFYTYTAGAEAVWGPGAATQYLGSPTATGFKGEVNSGVASGTFIYIAIRRGLMKVPTSGATVYGTVLVDDSGTGRQTVSLPINQPDLLNYHYRGAGGAYFFDKVRGTGIYSSEVVAAPNRLILSSTGAEGAAGEIYNLNNSTVTHTNNNLAQYGAPYTNDIIYRCFRRAPSFFDTVCYAGTNTGTNFTHNLGVVPELMIVKSRDQAQHWQVYTAATGNTSRLLLSATNAVITGTTIWNSTTPTASVFSLDGSSVVNQSGFNYVWYGFATLAGVSKVGSYTGTAALLTVNCGFTSGARFVLIKRTDSTGGWYVWDSVRGIGSGNDPYLFINGDTAEVTNTNYVDTVSTGFQVTAAAPAALNASGGSYIFLAIA